MTLPIQAGLINSPLWYTSSILDTLEWNHEEKSGIFYYGSRNMIYFIKIYEIANKSKLIDYDISKINYETKIQYYMKAHHEYIVGLCTIPNGVLVLFDKVKLLPRFASCGKDKMIRIWSYGDTTGCCCLKEFNLSTTKIVTSPTCISINSSNTIFCGFEKGYILSWNYLVESESRVFYTINECIVQIAWSDRKFAVAYKNGIVMVYTCTSYDSISKVTQFRAHRTEVCSVSWNPIINNIGCWGDLATSGKDRKVKLWHTEKNYNVQSLSLPNSMKKMNPEQVISGDSAPSSSNWSLICWSAINNGSLIVTTGFGNIGLWKSPSSTELKYFSQNNFTKPHGKSIFGVAEFRNHRGLLVSHSLDRLLNISRITDTTDSGGSGEHVYSMPCLGGSVLSLNAVGHGNQLAIGCSDNQIRLWRFDSNANTSSNRNEVGSMWNGIGGKVLALCWHPTKEGLLAFGTDAGDVGCVNVLKDKKVSVDSRLHHTGKVFVVTWAVDIRKDFHDSCIEEMRDSVVAYTVGNYALFLHDFRHNEFVDVSNIVAYGGGLSVSDFVSHDSLNYVAVGFGNGLVRVFAVQKWGRNRRDGPLTLVCQLSTHSKGINCMRWSPSSGADSVESYRLAVGSNERFLTVTDVSAVIDSFETNYGNQSDNWNVVEFNEPLVSFKGHGDRITSIDWCPFDSDKLVSGSYDNTAFVWSVSEKCAVANFTFHQGKIFCCQWSKRDRDLIYTGGEDGNLFAWRPSENEQLGTKGEITKRRNNIKPVPGISNQTEETITETAAVAVDCKEKKDIHDNKSKEKCTTYTKKRNSLFPTIFTMQHSLEAYQNAVLHFIEGRPDCLPCMTLFGSRPVILQQIARELIHHKDEKNLENYFTLLLWVGKVGQVLSESASMDYYADWLSSSTYAYFSKVPFLPEYIVKKAANTVSTKKDPILAATELLSIGMSREAVELLMKNDCMREALILAKLRLRHSDPLIGQLLSMLRDKYYKNGSFELAAVCSVLVGEYQKAVDSMGRRTSKLATWATIKILIEHQQDKLMHHCVFNFINGILLEGDTDSFNNQQWIDKIQTTNEISIYKVLIDLHRYLWVDIKSLKDIWAELKMEHGEYFGRSHCKLSMMRNEIQSKLSTKQADQSKSQESLYVTYEIMLLFINSIEYEDKSLNCSQLNYLINQFNNINLMDTDLINRLIGTGQQTDPGEELIKL